MDLRRSSVPQKLREIIRTYGGQPKETYGVLVEEIQRGIRQGVHKINVDADNRLAMTGAMRKVLHLKPDAFDPRDYLGAAREAIKQVCRDRTMAFGQAGHACHIREAGRHQTTKR